MKYIEYVYLVVALMIGITLVTEFEHLTTSTKIVFLVAIALAGFMFSFRRSQRLKFEKRFKEELRQLEEDEQETE
ncbi:MAG: hypothetical protein D6730_23430 [Bacteroidetes bacterium]|nr:MAG: hypothetical protein D6730_23430 [Bacteroidota bacterium]